MTGATLAIDIGGTKLLAALVEGADVRDAVRVATPREAGAEAWLDALASAAAPMRGRYARVAAAVSGIVADGCWSAANPATLPVPDRFPLVAALRRRFGVPAAAWNDAQAAAWAEWRFGAGEGRDTAFITVSSGIGGGLVLGGRLVIGATGLAGSLGQIPAGAARLEDRASGFALARRAAAAGHAADAAAVWEAARRGEAWAKAIAADAVAELARAITTLKLIADPEVVVIGGGLGLALGFIDALAAALDASGPLHAVPLRPARLGAHAGLVGAADLATAAG